MKMIYYVLLLVVLNALPTIAANEPAFTEGNLANITVSESAEPEYLEWEHRIRVLDEAILFFNIMISENMLPATPPLEMIKEQMIGVYPREERLVKNSIKVFTELRLVNAYHQYIIEKTELNNPWKVISAVELDMNKKKINDLPLPTLDDQNKANNKALELLPAALNASNRKKPDLCCQ